MPSVSVWLGSYVTLRPRADGTFRVLFEVPARLRPSGWPPQIPLPREGVRRGDLQDQDEVRRIRDEAKALYAALRAGKEQSNAAPAVARAGSVPWILRKWGGQRLLDAVEGRLSASEVQTIFSDDCSDDWRALAPRTRKSLVSPLRPVLAWSLTRGHPHMREMKPVQVRDFLKIWDASPGQKKNIRGALSQLIAIALEEGEIEISPLERVKKRKRKRVKGGRRVAVDRWTRAVVDGYAEVARTTLGWRSFRGSRTLRPWPGGSIMVQLMYQTAADSTDVITWRKGEGGHFADDTKVPGIAFDRGKTGQPAFIPISQSLASEIRANGSIYFVTDPEGKPYRPIDDDTRLRGHLVTLREKAVAAGHPYRVFDHLRHSAITEGVEGGIALDDMMHLSAHSDSEMNRTVYVQRSRVKAIEIQRARGLID